MLRSAALVVLLVLAAGIALIGAQRRRRLCSLPPSSGNCYGHYALYFYDSLFGRCRRFVYGGCGGNANRFRTQRECIRVCEEAGTQDDKV
ncbi:kunitz-type serine protease inhibitor-like [Dermacentor variabilis]|uniref:kunitz-type serine protease inhibitor-like n=1 Tax=Dermacentor variabilis TaxID=34621 RepID=UPI003F5AFDA8